MYRILLVLLLLVSSFVIAQQTPGEKTIESYNFGTLETKSGPFNAKAGGATTYHNLDPSRRLGSLNKRWGYSEIDELNDGFDSLTGIYSAYLSDGRQFLVYAADSAGVGYGGLYITESGSDSISNASQFWRHWSPTAPTTFSMFDDKLYAMNGVQAGAVYNFDTRKAIRFPIPAPSEPIVVPIDAGNNLDGEYRYAIYVYYNGVGNIKDLGVITAPVRVSTGSVLLTGFQRPNLDSLVTGSDSIHINVYRTLANPGRLEQTDTLWRVFTSYIDTAAIDTFTIIDTLADASINHTTFNKSPWSLYTQVTGLDSAGTWSYNKYGAPGYYRRGDSLYTLAKDTTRPGGIYNGIPRMNDTLGVFYAATFLDTLNSIESDTGRSLYVSNDSINGSAGRHWWIRLTMPKLPDSTENTVINLYRAHRIVVGRDTSFTIPSQSNPDKWVDEQNKKAGFDLYYIASENCRTANGVTICDKVIKMRSLTADTVVTSPYYLVAQVSSDSAYFTDSTRYDSLVLQPLYRKTPPSTRLTQPFAYNGRMFGIDGSNLAWSLVDSASRWGAFDFISVNKDDGQRITLAYPTRRSIRVLKDASSYNVYQDGGGNWNLAEVTNGIGCIAPNSHAVSPAGHYYLSQDGVILETEGDFLERTYKTGLISANLDNFDKLPMSAKSKAVGTYWNHKYFLTVPIAGAADTTYVWDELAQGWATWSMPIGGAAIYDTESVAGYAPGNSMYFYYPNGKTLYQYGNSLTDAGAYIWSNWTSTPFLTDEYEEAVSAIGVWFDDISSGDFIRFYDIVDGRDTVRSNLALFTDLGDTVGYREEAVASLRTGAYHQLAMWSTPDASGTWSRIDKINVSYLPLGKRTRFGETTAFVGGESGEGGAGTITFGDITGVIAGYGLSGGGLSGDVTLTSDTAVIATKQFVRDSAAAGIAPDSVMYADTAGVALNGGSTDSFYVAKGDTTVTGWKQSGDTIFVDTTGGSGTSDSFYVAKSDTTVIGWKQTGDTIFIDTTGGSGGGMSMDSTTAGNGLIENANDLAVRPGYGIDTVGDLVRVDVTDLDDSLMRIGTVIDSTTAGNGLIESANDLAVRPGYGIDTVGDLVRVDSTEFASVFRLRDTAAAVRADIRDTVAIMGITDSTTAGNGLGETGNDIYARPGYGIDTVGDLIRVDSTEFASVFRLRDTAAAVRVDIRDTVNIMGITDSTAAGNGLTESGNTINAVGKIYILAGADSLALDTANLRTWAATVVVDSAKKVDTTYTPLRALVNRHIRDTAAVMIEDSLDNYFLSASDLDPDQLSGDATDNNLVDSAIVQGVSPAKIGAAGATAGDVLTYSGSAWEPQAAGSVANLTVYGDFNIFGNVKQTNRRQAIDIQNAYASHALEPLMIVHPDTITTAYGTNDSTTLVHPSVVYIPGGWPAAKPYKYWMSLTIGHDDLEDGVIRVSNDGETWTNFVVNATDSCPDPLITEAALPKSDGTTYPTSHLSDNDMVIGHDGKMHVYIRNTDVTPNPDQNSIWHVSSADGVTWSSPVKVIDWRTTTQNQLLSPAVWLDTNGTYKMWTIGYDGANTTSLTLWESDSADGVFDSVKQVKDSTTNAYIWADTTLGGDRFGGLRNSLRKDSAAIWHVDVMENGADEKFALFTVRTMGGGTYNALKYYLCPAVTRDGGQTVVIRREPMLADSAYDRSRSVGRAYARFDWNQIYKSTGVYVDNGNGGYIDLFYGANGGGNVGSTNSIVDTFNNQYRIARTRLEFLTSATMPRVQVSGRQKAPTDSLNLTFGGWVDSTTGVTDLFVDSSGYGGVGAKVDYVYATFKADHDFVLDSLIFRWMHTEAGTGSSTLDSIRTDSLILYGPDQSNGTNACDSVWWVQGGADSITGFASYADAFTLGWAVSSRTRTAIPLRLHKMAPAGSIFRLVMINRFNAARSAVHVEDIEIKGRSR